MKGLPINFNYIVGGLNSNRERCGSLTGMIAWGELKSCF